jgi:flagellar motor switch protein FliG
VTAAIEGANPDTRVPGRSPREAAGELSGVRKAALLVAQLTTEEASMVLAELRPREVERLAGEITRLDRVDIAVVDGVLGEFHQRMQARSIAGQGGAEFAQEILAAGLGADKAEELLARVNTVHTEVPFGSLRAADTRQLVTHLKDEHPQLIALVLAHLPLAQSAEVLAVFPAELQAEIAYRIAVTDKTSPAMVGLVEEELHDRMGALLREDTTTVGGVATLVEIINRSPRPSERAIMESLQASDPELAEQVRAQMFLFEDIVTIDDRSLQLVLREVEAGDLATALKGVRPDVRDKVVRNLSERAAENLTEEIELLGPVRTRTIEEAQTKIVGVIRTLEEAGELTLSRGEEDMIA